jgi:hypothetical protein
MAVRMAGMMAIQRAALKAVSSVANLAAESVASSVKKMDTMLAVTTALL